MDFNKIKNWVKENKTVSVILAVLLIIVVFQFLNRSGLYLGTSMSDMAYSPKIGNYGGYNEVADSVASRNSMPSMQENYSDYAATDVSVSDRKIIQNGSLNAFVEDIDTSTKKIESIASKYDGFVQNTNIRESSNYIKSGFITIKIPAEYFQDAMNDIKDNLDQIKSESVNTDDVTERFVDLRARLNNQRVLESRLINTLSRAEKITDILAVEKELSRVRGEIERIQGQLNYLSRQTDMSEITVNLTSEADVQIFGVTWKPLNTLREGVRDFLTDMKNLYEGLIAFLFALPGIILRVIFFITIIWVVIKSFNFLKRKLFTNKAGNKK